VNEEVLLERMEVRDGMLVLAAPGARLKPDSPVAMSYRLLVLPDRDAISPAVLRRIGELVEAGATVVGRRPDRSNSLRGHPGCDREVRELAARIWGDCDGDGVRVHAHGKGRVIWNIPLGEVLAGMGTGPDFVVEGSGNRDRSIDFIHRATADEDLYFVSNSSMERREIRCRFRVGPGRVPSFWHPQDGSVNACHLYQVGDGFVRVPIDLAPASSVFVVFRESALPDHLVRIERRAAALDGGGASSPAGGGIELLGMDAATVDVRVRLAGRYDLETARGRRGCLVVDEVPADRVLEGPWRLSFPEGWGAPRALTLTTLVDWAEHADPGVRHFSGTAHYECDFVLPDTIGREGNALFLDLGTVREVAAVTVNGIDAGLLWKQPFRLDIGPFVHGGRNQLGIAVTNLWNNRIVGDLRQGPDNGLARTNLKKKFSSKSPLLPSGLIGPVRLQFPVQATIDLPR
jgi:hypothetical protein